MYNSGNSSKNVTGASVVDGTLYTVDIADDAVTADKLANAINTDIATGVSGSTTAGDALPKAGGAMTGAITTNSTFDGVDVATRDAVLTSTTNTADAALPKAGGTMTGNITNLSTLGDMNLKATGGASGAEVHRLEWHNNQYQIASLRAVVGVGQINRGELHFYTENGAGQGLALKIDPWRNVTATNGIRIGTAGAGIDFSGVGTAAEILDDYEEGTWTPEFRGSTGSAGTSSTTITNAVYTKVGNIVTASCDIRWALIGSWTGSVLLYGLPFPAGAKFVASTAILKNVENPDTLPFVGVVYPAASNFEFFRQISDLGMKYQAPVTYFDNVLNEFNISITYTV